MENQFLKTIYEKLVHLSNKIEDLIPQHLVFSINFEKELKNTLLPKKFSVQTTTYRNFFASRPPIFKIGSDNAELRFYGLRLLFTI
jgi:hypothetical protein